MHPINAGAGEIDVVVQRIGSVKEGPGLAAWRDAFWDAFCLAVTVSRNVGPTLQQLLGQAQQLEQQGRHEEAEAVLDQGLASLTDLPFALLEMLPPLLEAGHYNVALRAALAAYEKQEKSLGRTDKATIVAGVPLGIALAAHRHNEGRPLLKDALWVTHQRKQKLAAIKTAVVAMDSRRGWRAKLSRWLWFKLQPVEVLWGALYYEAGFYHVLSQLMESRYEVDRTWRSSARRDEIKTKLGSMTSSIGGMADNLGPDHARVQGALREYERAVESAQLRRQRHLRQALKSHGRELRRAVEAVRKDKATVVGMWRRMTQAWAAKEVEPAQEVMQQLIMFQLRKQGLLKPEI
ncbi:acetylglucosamine transferase isoform B [Chlorella sorokiniana]|uniref:Acetylglucosamine transferase isoform B n=1 Tax=Chlorella sorokiniana TaxID=3076 RepID=A0A2P6TLV3_CHLSO|nr:acetylglucosamine transferase isoform B [Chlorella sorokiniana]|eukprot:PRW45320.1 acetylglucosamine transferase isoform B [Chlorella sorokiniana]